MENLVRLRLVPDVPLFLAASFVSTLILGGLNPVKTGSLVASQTRIIECNPHIELKLVV
jgi:hypothetical protein